MPAGVLLDTSFLLTLADKNRANHDTARRYWQHFLETQMPIFLPTIVVSEFCMKQEIPPDMLRCCVILPFNWDDAQRAAKLDWKRDRPAGVERQAVKDDIKIIAQAAVAEVEFVITDDKDTFYAYCKAFKEAGEVLFTQLGCAVCHQPSFTTGPSSTAALNNQPVPLYSDLLLHDMGSLGDGIAQSSASPQEMKTPPLSGLRGNPTYLHDGRAGTVDQAIRAHAGEAATARGRYVQLTPAQQQQLLEFLHGL